MLKSYETTLDHDRLVWLGEAPDIVKARIIVTILEDRSAGAVGRSAPSSIAGKGKTLGDIVSPIVPEEDWECLK